MGVDAFKTDFGERIPTDVVWHDGADPEKMHNYYPFLYNKVVHDALIETRGAKACCSLARPPLAVSVFPVHWGGDCYSDYPAMAETLRGGLSLGLSGLFGFWSHDIGGFENTRRGRRLQALVRVRPPVQPQPSATARNPIGYPGCSIRRRRRCSATSRAPQVLADALPLCRRRRSLGKRSCRCFALMLLEFPRRSRRRDARPPVHAGIFAARRTGVFDKDGEVAVYLPAGRWTQLLTGEVSGGRTDLATRDAQRD